MSPADLITVRPTLKPNNARKYLGIVAVFLIGTIATFGVALSAGAETIRSNKDDFSREAANARGQIEREIERHVSALNELGNFAYATWPGDLGEWQRFVKDRGAIEPYPAFQSSPGLVERVPVDQIDALIARETESVGEPFEVRSYFPLPADADRLIITRTGEAAADGFLARGVEITGALDALSLQLPTVEDGQLIVSIAGAPPMILDALGIDPADTDEKIRRTDVAFIQPVGNIGGETIGWIIALGQLEFLLSTAINELHGAINLAVTAPGGEVEGPVGYYNGVPGLELADAQFKDRSEFSNGGWVWRIDVWADEEYGVTESIFGDMFILLVGLTTTVVITLLAVLGRNHSERLNDARFEIELQRTMAETDSLTGLLNRQGLRSRLRESKAASEGATVFFLDLDDFKSINDRFGHAVGDQTLTLVGDRLRSVARHADLIGRLGGDEFIVVCPGLVDPVQATNKARLMAEAIRTANASNPLRASIGIATSHPSSEFDIDALLRQADHSMYEVKKSGAISDNFTPGDAQPQAERTTFQRVDLQP